MTVRERSSLEERGFGRGRKCLEDSGNVEEQDGLRSLVPDRLADSKKGDVDTCAASVVSGFNI